MKLSARKTKLVFETGCTVWSQGASRAVIVEAQPEGGLLRLAGTLQRLPFDWADVYYRAAKHEADRVAAAKTATAKRALADFHAKAEKPARR